MGDSKADLNCLNCGRPETEIPLITARYAGDPIWICSNCLPVLIHNPQQLTGTLKGADNIPPSPHSH
jgi:hypothetical protein